MRARCEAKEENEEKEKKTFGSSRLACLEEEEENSLAIYFFFFVGSLFVGKPFRRRLHPQRAPTSFFYYYDHFFPWASSSSFFFARETALLLNEGEVEGKVVETPSQVYRKRLRHQAIRRSRLMTSLWTWLDIPVTHGIANAHTRVRVVTFSRLENPDWFLLHPMLGIKRE